MTKLSTLALLLSLFAGVAACGGEAPDAGADEAAHQHMHQDDPAAGTAATEAEMQDGVQVAHITVGAMGFAPRSIRLQGDVPARLIFTRTVSSSCSEQVQIPDFGVEKTDLPLNEPVAIAFTPDENGAFTFVCGMDMVKGTVVVKM